MNWKEEAMEKLRRYRLMANSAHSIPMELERLAEEAQTLRTAPFGGGSRRNLRSHEDRLLDNLTQRQALEQQLERVECWVQVTQQALEQLEPREQTILRRLYMEGMDTSAVGRELGLERSSLYRLRDEALKKLTIAMYGGIES